MLDSGKPVQFIDARPRHSVSRTQDIIEGATWRDPDRVQEWAGELSKSEPVVVFCVYGFHVGCKTAIALREAGLRRDVHEGRPFRVAGDRRPDPRQPLILGRHLPEHDGAAPRRRPTSARRTGRAASPSRRRRRARRRSTG